MDNFLYAKVLLGGNDKMKTIGNELIKQPTSDESARIAIV